MYKCGYCEREFAREQTLAVHMCEQKRRHMVKGDRHVQLGFRAYQNFYALNTNTKNDKTTFCHFFTCTCTQFNTLLSIFCHFLSIVIFYRFFTKIYKSLQKWRVVRSQGGQILKTFVYPSSNTSEVGPCEFWCYSGRASQNCSAGYESRFNRCFSAFRKAKCDLIHRSLVQCSLF